MLKYLYYKEVFTEVPGEMTLGISISGCKIHCKGCHSTDLWENQGTELTIEEVKRLISEHPGITCVLLFGGEHDIDTLQDIFKHIHGRVKTAWYCGLDTLTPKQMQTLQYLDFIKIGHYDMQLGGLDSPKTNQRLWQRHNYSGDPTKSENWTNITAHFWEHVPFMRG